MAIPYAEVIGDPIAHSKSPTIHLFWLAKLGMEGDYRAVQVSGEALPTWLAQRRHDPDWRGCNVTIPHKRTIMGLLDVIDDGGVGAVNCVVPDESLIGLNTDVAGVLEAIEEGVDPSLPACLVGAGGGARAALVALKQLGVNELRVVARDLAKARKLLDGFGMAGEAFDFESVDQAVEGASGIINSTPLGLAGFPSMPESVLGSMRSIRPEGFALDMVYGSAPTEFVSHAGQAGLKASDGLVMLVGQARRAFHAFFDAKAPAEHDTELRALLTS